MRDQTPYMPSHNGVKKIQKNCFWNILSIVFNLFKKMNKEKRNRGGGQKDMSWKLVSKPNITSMCGVIYPYVSKIKFEKFTELSLT